MGGWDSKRDMGMSVGVTYSTGTGEYSIFREETVDGLVDQLRRADLVVGFNILHFDYEVLMGYTVLDLPSQLATLDLMLDIEKEPRPPPQARIHRAGDARRRQDGGRARRHQMVAAGQAHGDRGILLLTT